MSQGGSTTVSTVPLFTYQRAYTYAADGRTLTITDNGGTVIIDAQLDERGTVVREEQRNSISPEAYRPVFFSMGLQDVYRFPDKSRSDLFEYTYNGPGGLISEVYNRSTGITYRFLYEPK